MKKELKVPKFKSAEEEFEFWSNINLADYYNAEDFKPVVFPNLKSTTKSISIRLPEYLLAKIKETANSQDVPYQSLIKSTLAKRFNK